MSSISWKQNWQVVKESRTTNPRRQSSFGLFWRIESLRVVYGVRAVTPTRWFSTLRSSFVSLGSGPERSRDPGRHAVLAVRWLHWRWQPRPKAAWLLSCRERPQLASGRLIVFFILNTCPWPSAASLVGYAEADAGVIVPNVKTL